jgi:hypothetical protein
VRILGREQLLGFRLGFGHQACVRSGMI